MDNAKRFTVEFRAALGLLAALGVVLFLTRPWESLRAMKPSQQGINVSVSAVSDVGTGDALPERSATKGPGQLGSVNRVIHHRTVTYSASHMRDPMQNLLPLDVSGTPDYSMGARPAAAPEPVQPPPTLTVEGLLWGSAQPQAIIDGGVYRIGDSVSGSQILAIDQRGVTIDFLGNEHSYPISSGIAQ